MKAPFVFRPQLSFTAMLAAIFAAQRFQQNREIDPPDRDHQGTTGGPHQSKPQKHWISKKERKRRQHVRLHTQDRKH